MHKEFISFIDHKSLKYIYSQATLYHKHARWMFLQNYIFLVQHKRVKSNLVVDAFGRRHHLLVTMTNESVGFEALKDSYDANDLFLKHFKYVHNPMGVDGNLFKDYLMLDDFLFHGKQLCILAGSLREN